MHDPKEPKINYRTGVTRDERGIESQSQEDIDEDRCADLMITRILSRVIHSRGQAKAAANGRVRRSMIRILKMFLIYATCLILLGAVEVWKITAYCACKKCCGKSDGITASGKNAVYGYVACNWLPFGTTVAIDGIGEFTVQDRGAKSQFGDDKNHIKHLDVYMPTHEQARQFGVLYRKVYIEPKGKHATNQGAV